MPTLDSTLPNGENPSSKNATYFADNEANWNDRANLHMNGGYEGIDELVSDPHAISPELAEDIDRFGPLDGKSVIHLQCHLGTDTIGFPRRGASRTVGLDFSENSLTYAKEIAERAGVAIEYVYANVYDARTAVTGTFDLVYTSIGVLCWLPDVREWARTVASLMKPGATFFIRDDHPMFMTIADDASTGLRVELPYFERPNPETWVNTATYVPTPGAFLEHSTNHEWNHSLGEIISALIQAGLVIDDVEETPFSAWAPWPDLMVKEGAKWRLRELPERLPLQYAITAHKG